MCGWSRFCDSGKFYLRHAKYFKSMLNMGVYLPPSQYECLFLSTAIDDNDIDHLIKSNKKALEELK